MVGISDRQDGGRGADAGSGLVNIMWYALAPVIPIICGLVLKVSVIGVQIHDGQDVFSEVKKEYFSPLWIELLITAVAFGLGSRITTTEKFPNFLIPVWIFAVLFCLFLTRGLANLGVQPPDICTIWIPSVSAYIAAAVTSVVVSRYERYAG